MNTDKGIGMFVGLAIGDALGAVLEFQEPREPENYVRCYLEGGAHKVSIGEWTDDTSMALAMAKSLLEKKSFDANDIMSKFCKWYKGGEFSPRGKCFDIGGTTAIALSSYLHEIVKDEYVLQPYRGRTAHDSSGNGALMRLAPVIMVAQDPYHAMQLATQQTLLTHGSNICVDYSVMLAEELYYGYPISRYSSYKLPLDIDRNDVMSGGYVKETYECAWWAFQTTNNFVDCITKAVNRGHDADTSGAVAGMIAGRYYGITNIPSYFKDNLMWYDKLYQTAIDLCNMEWKYEYK
jgi:ADP-ribosyl-[dinitrogen reductase] hydrolase|tara:strand:- start:4318 stop:5196 length:879 start_codon:yes stop_codon:yes gene_type:complete